MYLSGELDTVQGKEFEAALLTNPVLRREMNLYKEVDQALADSEVLELRSQLNALHEPMLQEIEANRTKTGKHILRYSAAAATIAVLLGIGFLSLLKNPDNIIRKFYNPYAMTMVTRSADMNVDLILREALSKYDSKQYREAVILFEKVIKSDPEMISANLYAGISYFEIKEYSHAELNFNKIIKHDDNLFIEQAEWYMGFCYLMTGRKEEAIKQFGKIVRNKGYYSDKAKDILKKLK